MAAERIQIPIDRFGRIVLPKGIRDRLGVSAGTEFEVEETEDAILLKPVQKKAHLIRKGGWLVVRSEKPLDEDTVRKTIEKVREDRNRKLWG